MVYEGGVDEVLVKPYAKEFAKEEWRGVKGELPVFSLHHFSVPFPSHPIRPSVLTIFCRLGCYLAHS
jgi:hypothetical protein